MYYPPVSCYCSTYGRPKFLIENCIYWFLQQDYPGKKELVILNDLDCQTLIFDHPEVNIINLSSKIRSLGEKFNRNIEFCNYDLLATWEDDDIFLPHRLKLSVDKMINGIFHTRDGYYEEKKEKIIKSYNYFHSTHLFERQLFEEVGRYDEIDKYYLDVSLIKKFENKLGYYSQTLKNEELFYIYSWAESNSYHGSASGNMDMYHTSERHVKNDLIRGYIEDGNILLDPKPKYNIIDFLPKL